MKPEFVVPGSVAADLVLVRTDEVAVTIGLLRVYTTGFELTVDSRSRRAALGHRIGGMSRRYTPAGIEPEDGLRLGMEFSDGRRAELDAPRSYPDQADPGALVVMPDSSGGSDRKWYSRFWVYPLPPSGPVVFVATWPAFGVAEARVELEADAILSAASRAIVLWPEREGEPLGESTVGVVTAQRAERGDHEPGPGPRT
jgi:hypothetical protein